MYLSHEYFIICTYAFCTLTVESAPLPSEPVHKSDFSEHVKAMHKERGSGFEREYQVCMHATMLSHLYINASTHKPLLV